MSGVNCSSRSVSRFGLAAVVVLATTWQTAAQGVPAPPAIEGADRETHPFPRRVAAPSLDGDFEWVNTTKPLTLAELRGKFVLIDFWTLCCINCMHVLPELKKLEQAYPTELLVVGVHSAKFEGEQDSGNIREAVERYEIEHPIVNDAKMTIWYRYGIQSWPTLVLIDPEGQAVWVGSGERKFEDVKAIIDRGLPYYRSRGLLNTAPVTFVAKPEVADTPLRFPGKILADEPGGRLFIADSNHNRIVIADLAGKVQTIVGTGEVGRAEGAFDQARFHHPQGMALAGEDLYVADTENHLLRKVDLAGRKVTTIAGTGEQGSGFPGPLANGRFGGLPLSTPLNSPWALCVEGGNLYVAMAGPHQIWRLPLEGGPIELYTGNGREDIVDGRRLPSRPYATGFASFAQPSGLASDGKRLFVADSEGSAIRSVSLEPAGRVATIVGVPGSLFDFGDVDGEAGTVRLQHPLGIVFHRGKLYVADTYNNKVKVLDPATRTCRTLAGTGKVGNDDAAVGTNATFNEPAGITAAGGKLYVADTNNHAIRVVELRPPCRVTTLIIDLPAKP
jgi:DNA-binding beta-propeller fold protein YncE